MTSQEKSYNPKMHYCDKYNHDNYQEQLIPIVWLLMNKSKYIK
jgi:hypothetical protein